MKLEEIHKICPKRHSWDTTLAVKFAYFRKQVEKDVVGWLNVSLEDTCISLQPPWLIV